MARIGQRDDREWRSTGQNGRIPITHNRPPMSKLSSEREKSSQAAMNFAHCIADNTDGRTVRSPENHDPATTEGNEANEDLRNFVPFVIPSTETSHANTMNALEIAKPANKSTFGLRRIHSNDGFKSETDCNTASNSSWAMKRFSVKVFLSLYCTSSEPSF